VTERLAETVRRIDSVHALGDVVTAMRSISVSRVQQAHTLLNGVRAYETVIASAIRRALPLLPETDHVPHTRDGRGLIVFCAEQGFAGAFSDRILDAVVDAAPEQDVFLVGTRGAALAQERGIKMFWQTAMVPRANLIAGLTGRIADALYAWIAGRSGSRVEMIVPCWRAGQGVSAERRSLLPFDFKRFSQPPAGQVPLITLPPGLLLARLAEEYVFSEVCEAALSAFAAENEARVAIMMSAKGHLDDMLSGLQALERQIRQEEITAEVVELASGSAASGRLAGV
jgi:F-type H+-transporting ATPase subunit gamma